MAGSILKISEAASIGLHAMIILAKNQNRLVSVKEIATALDISANHLSKVMQRLNKAGLIDSIKGYNGGFKLVERPENINFLKIYELIDGKLCNSKCILSKDDCSQKCILADLVTSVNKQVKDKFEKTTLADFIE